HHPPSTLFPYTTLFRSNRRGDTFYLHEGRTKTGKAKFFFSRKREGTLAGAVPAGFEVYENPNAQVFLRKALPGLVTDEEVAAVEDRKSTRLNSSHRTIS